VGIGKERKDQLDGIGNPLLGFIAIAHDSTPSLGNGNFLPFKCLLQQFGLVLSPFDVIWYALGLKQSYIEAGPGTARDMLPLLYLNIRPQLMLMEQFGAGRLNR
jgi:hypothetical protein